MDMRQNASASFPEPIKHVAMYRFTSCLFPKYNLGCFEIFLPLPHSLTANFAELASTVLEYHIEVELSFRPHLDISSSSSEG